MRREDAQPTFIPNQFYAECPAFMYRKCFFLKSGLAPQPHPALMLCSHVTKLRGVLTVWGFNSEKKSTLTQTSHHLTITEIPASSIAMMFGYSRRYQRASFIRLSFFKHMRRYILALNQLTLDLSV